MVYAYRREVVDRANIRLKNALYRAKLKGGTVLSILKQVEQRKSWTYPYFQLSLTCNCSTYCQFTAAQENRCMEMSKDFDIELFPMFICFPTQKVKLCCVLGDSGEKIICN